MSVVVEDRSTVYIDNRYDKEQIGAVSTLLSRTGQGFIFIPFSHLWRQFMILGDR